MDFKYKLYNDQPITEKSIFTFKHCSRPEASYCRDLFVHEYGANVIMQSVPFLAMIDGMVIGTAGVNRAMGPGVKKYFNALMLQYAIGKSSDLYPRLSKLVAFGVTTTEFLSIVRNSVRSFDLHEFGYMRSCCWSRFPEIKSDRGVFKLDSREKISDTRYKLIYSTPFRNITLQEALKQWLKKWGQTIK
ncbi:MAG: hypothetical protein M0R74_18800 [Dehalococcoidia bacterium]|jgi:hypothetical protein|nr:hypothetical protein [Dehalococcoidia bacterium]